MLIVLRIDHRRPRVHSLKERMTSDEQVEPRGSRIPLKFQSLVPAGEAFPAASLKNIRESGGEQRRKRGFKDLENSRLFLERNYLKIRRSFSLLSPSPNSTLSTFHRILVLLST